MPKKATPDIEIARFRKRLMNWNQHHNRRQMPWKGERDAYRIWLSEIILQQTRVEQGLAYYQRFVSAFPRIEDLAAAPDERVMKLWEGLGYYSRCRNLIATARYIARELQGDFPDTFESILTLKGVGPYTAAAIASFAYNLPHAVVDGNVYRVLARVFGINTPIDSTEGKKQFSILAQQLVDEKQPGRYNQAIMDFGATVCKPMAPACSTCVMKDICVAWQKNKVEQLPVKSKKLKQRTRRFAGFYLQYHDQVLIRRREAKDIWQHLYELPLLELEDELPPVATIAYLKQELGLAKKDYTLQSSTGWLSQQLSHQRIMARIFSVELKKRPAAPSGAIWVKKEDLEQYPFPRLFRDYLQQRL